MRVLVVGGSGYLGQHLSAALSCTEGVRLNTTYTSNLVVGGEASFLVDLTTGEGLDRALAHGPDVVVNTAAISSPGACEKDPEAAAAINVPTKLLEQLTALETPPLLIHLSTDQVYSGEHPSSDESTPAGPINTYARTKLAAEQLIGEMHTGRSVCLRSSIIYGPQTPVPVQRSLFVQWLDKELGSGSPEPLTLFEDQFRNPIHVDCLVRAIVSLIENRDQLPPGPTVFCAGGKDRLNRVQMGEAVARVRERPTDRIQAITYGSLGLSTPSPCDISMNSSALEKLVGFEFKGFEEGVRLTFG